MKVTTNSSTFSFSSQQVCIFTPPTLVSIVTLQRGCQRFYTLMEFDEEVANNFKILLQTQTLMTWSVGHSTFGLGVPQGIPSLSPSVMVNRSSQEDFPTFNKFQLRATTRHIHDLVTTITRESAVYKPSEGELDIVRRRYYYSTPSPPPSIYLYRMYTTESTDLWRSARSAEIIEVGAFCAPTRSSRPAVKFTVFAHIQRRRTGLL